MFKVLMKRRMMSRAFLVSMIVLMLAPMFSFVISSDNKAYATHEVVCEGVSSSPLGSGAITIRAESCQPGETQLLEGETFEHDVPIAICKLPSGIPPGADIYQVERGDGADCEGPFGIPTGDEVASFIGGQGAVGQTGGGAQNPGPSCESNVTGLGWLLCAVVETLLKLFEDLLGGTVIRTILEYDLLNEPAQAEGLRSIWAGFRTLANVGFVIAFMVVIYSAATGNALSAYDVKRLLPRLLIGAIAVNLSFFICRELVGFFNDLGNGIRDIMLAPVGGGQALYGEVSNNFVDWTEAGATILTVLLLTVAFLFSIGGIITVILAFLLRNIALTVLVVISPIAFVAWILPNTDGFYKRWSKLFINMLMLFPMTMAFLSAGALVSSIWATGSGAGFGDTFISVVARFIPWLMIGKIGQLTNDLTSGAVGAVDRVRNQVRDRGGKLADTRVGRRARSGDLTAGNTAAQQRLNNVARRITNPRASRLNPLEGDRTRAQARARASVERMDREDTEAVATIQRSERARVRSRAAAAGEDADQAEIAYLVQQVRNGRAEERRAAAKTLLNVHSNSPDAVRAINRTVSDLRSSGRADDIRLADVIVEDNIGTAGSIPQLYKDNNRDTVRGLNTEGLHGLKGGSLRLFLEDEGARDEIASRYLSDIENENTRGQVKFDSARRVYRSMLPDDPATDPAAAARAAAFAARIEAATRSPGGDPGWDITT